MENLSKEQLIEMNKELLNVLGKIKALAEKDGCFIDKNMPFYDMIKNVIETR